MPNSPSFRQSLGPLTVGNVISAALRIYRDHFSVYYKLAFIAHLWLLVPIYGWAKFAAISGLISRLTYREIIESPETVHEARRHVNPHLWTFFWTGFLVGFIMFIAGLIYSIFAVIIVGLFALIFQANPNNTAILIVIILLSFLGIIVFISGYIWLYSRLSLAELAIAIEEQAKATEAITRSSNITQGFVVRLQLIFFVAYLLTIPISFFVQLLSQLVNFFVEISIGSILAENPSIYLLIYLPLTIIIAFAAGALIIPFWQAIKAVIYYDLRSRKEGIDLQIRDSL